VKAYRPLTLRSRRTRARRLRRPVAAHACVWLVPCTYHLEFFLTLLLCTVSVQTYCEFGGSKGLREMDNVKFMKLAKETGLVDRHCTKTDIDLIFVSSKPKGLRRLNFDQYLIALDKIGESSH
jgi:hypothetical protein